MAPHFRVYQLLLHRFNNITMLHRRGPFNQDQLIEELQKHLPFDGESMQSYDVEYMDEDLKQVMIANFIWVNQQWVFVDSRMVSDR